MNQIARHDEATARGLFLTALGERVRALRARRGMTRKRLAEAAGVSERHLANLETGSGQRVGDAAARSSRERSGARSPSWSARRPRRAANGRASARCCAAATRRRSRARARRSPRCWARHGRRPGRERPHRAHRPARRRQVDARPHAGRRPGRAVRRARSRSSSASRAATWARSIRCTAPPRSAATSCARSRTPIAAPRAGGHRDRRRPRHRARDLRPPARALLHRVAARDARRAHEARHRPGRPAADGGQRRGDGRPEAHPRRPRSGLREGRPHVRHQRASRSREVYLALRDAIVTRMPLAA